MWFKVIACMEFVVDDDESKYKGMMPCSCMEISPPMTSLGDDESLVFGEGVDEKFLSLFFIVEFQKFLISLSVRPGKRAAI